MLSCCCVIVKELTDPAQDKDKTKIAPVSKKEETDTLEKKNETITQHQDSMIKEQLDLSKKDTEQKENEKRIISPKKVSQQVKHLKNITSPIILSKPRIGSKDKVTYEEMGIKNLTLGSPVPQ